jgi:peptidylprolyl isomerase
MKRYAFLVGVLVLIAVLVTGCAGGGGAIVGDSVLVHYTGTLDDGTVFDSSLEREPLSFVIGDGTMLVAFDEEVRGMEVGDTKTFTIPAAGAYGEYREDLRVVLGRDEVAADVEVGERVPLKNVTTDEVIYFTVVAVTATEVTLDANHPLAGQDLTFEIELVAINPPVDIPEQAEE